VIRILLQGVDIITRQEKMLKLREELLAVEEDRIAGRTGVTPDELDSHLESIIDEVEHGCHSFPFHHAGAISISQHRIYTAE
jgi:hypothetical protein